MPTSSIRKLYNDPKSALPRNQSRYSSAIDEEMFAAKIRLRVIVIFAAEIRQTIKRMSSVIFVGSYF